MTNPTAPNRPQVEAWLAATERELDNLEDRLQPLLEERKNIRERLTLLQDLLSSFPGGEPSEEGVRQSDERVAIRSNGSVGERVRAQVRLILKEAGAPMHINDIHQEFISRGFEVPGKGKPNNITAHLSRDEYDVASPKRGFYVLKERATQ